MAGRAIKATALAALLVALPSWAAADDSWGDEEQDASPAGVQIHGFVEAAGSGRVVNDPTSRHDFTLGEGRFRLELRHERDRGALSFKGDLLADGATQAVELDLREVLVTWRLLSWLDLRVGRQVLTWGTGDMLFVNDLFPKDWQSFFIGRADEYLKAPSNTVKLALYSQLLNLDLVWTPIFTPDRYITGQRLSFFSPMAGQRVGGGVVVDPAEPPLQLRTGEFAGRLHRRIGSLELAAYGYWGFYKQPLGYDPAAKQPTFPRLGVFGGSLRTALLGGLFNLEGAFYYSPDDDAGTSPLVPNSQVRGLAGYERELVARMTVGLQYYVEHILHHSQQLSASPSPALEPDEVRHVVTLRWTFRLLQDDLVLSLFAYVSPSDVDAYLRPSVSYKLTDGVQATAGANVVLGQHQHTFFGQLERNTNVYGRLRYTF